jgi:hypothetical protein
MKSSFIFLSILSTTVVSVPTNPNGPQDREVVLDKRGRQGQFPDCSINEWRGFTFGEEGSHVYPCHGGTPDGEPVYGYSFFSEGCSVIEVTGGNCWGNQFEILHRMEISYDSEVSLGNTSLPGKTECGNDDSDPNASFADPDMSSGSFLVFPGKHYVELNVLLSPFRGGGAFIRARPTECPFSCDGRANGFQQCKSAKEYYDCSWEQKLVRPVSPGTECCDWSAAERVLLVGEGATCPF